MCKLLNGKSLLFAALLLSAISMSCSHDPHDENQDPSNTDVHEWEDSTLSGDAVMGSAMTFKVGGGMSVERTAQTRAITDINGIATFTEGDFVAVAVTRSGGSEVVKLYQVKSDGSLEYAGGDNDPFVWKSAGESVTIRAWSYGTSTNLSYTLTAPETQDYSLETDQQTNGYRELLYCKAANKSYSSGAISLNFYHQLARVVFNVTHELSGTLSVTSNSVGNITSFPITARFAVPTGSSNVGTWTMRSTYNTITPKTETTQSGYEKTYSAVVFPTTYMANTNFFTVTNDEGNYVYKSAGATLTGGNQYNYTILVKDGNGFVKKNPLWWVAQYNLKNTTTFETSHSNSGAWGYSLDASPTGISVSDYHIPNVYEIAILFPSISLSSSTDQNLWAVSSNVNSPTEWTEINNEFGGTTVTSPKSVFYLAGTQNTYGIRYIGTEYASAWHIQYVTSPCNGALVESYLIDGATTVDNAKTLLKTIASSSVWKSYNSSSANKTPENTSTTSEGYVQRFFPITGIKGTGTGTVDMQITTSAEIWYYHNNKGYYGEFWASGAYNRRLLERSHGMTVRLYRDAY